MEMYIMEVLFSIWINGLSHFLLITSHIVWPPDASLSQWPLQKDVCVPFDEWCGFVLQRPISDSTPYLSVRRAHPSDHTSVSLLESHDPITLSLVHHRIDPDIPAVILLHEMLKT